MSEPSISDTFQANSLSCSLTVKDLAVSRRWYEGALGFTVTQEYEREGQLRAIALRAGGARILLNQDDGAKGWDRTKGEGFSVHFTTSQDIDEIARGIVERGGSLATEPADMPWGVRAFRLVDPDGFKLSIASERPSAD